MKNPKEAMVVNIVGMAMIASIAIVSAIHICVAAVRFVEKERMSLR